MNNIQIYIIVEGQTEQTFIKDVLTPYMATRSLYLFPVIIGKPGHKGGDIRFERAKPDIERFLNQRKDTYVSTMFDYFRINEDWPGFKDVKNQKEKGVNYSADQKAEVLEKAMKKEIVNSFSNADTIHRFIPYIQMHEFEALLFTNAGILAEKTNTKVSSIQEILQLYNDLPEEINEDPQKAPSKRLEKLIHGYRKVFYGKVISETITIDTICKKCPHFNNWLTHFESLLEQ